ncbi:hypothetical protein SH139x_003093 [Planctomycetaceae bacterium SH139]
MINQSDTKPAEQSSTARKRMLLTAWLVTAMATPGCMQTKQCGSCLPNSSDLHGPQAGIVNTDRCVDPLAPGAIPSPPGTYVNQWSEAMSQQAANQQSIITRNLWFNGSTDLGPDGQEKMVDLADSLTQYPHLVLLEEEPINIKPDQTYQEALYAQLEINETRRTKVIDSLAALGVVGIDNLVTFTTDKPVGVRGIEAPQIYNTQFMGGGMMMGGGRGGRGGGMGGMGMGGMGGMGMGMGGGMGGGGFF